MAKNVTSCNFRLGKSILKIQVSKEAIMVKLLNFITISIRSHFDQRLCQKVRAELT